MSRIGRLPVTIPAGVEIEVSGQTVQVRGPKGKLAQELPPRVAVEVADGQVRVIPQANDRAARSQFGLARTLIQNMVDGVSRGFEKGLSLEGVGYRAAKQGNKLVLTVGYSHPVEIVPGDGLEIEVPTPNKIIVRGADKEKVGNLAARIRAVREPEPYKGKGIRYDNEYVRRKAGKAGKAGGGKGKK